MATDGYGECGSCKCTADNGAQRFNMQQAPGCGYTITNRQQVDCLCTTDVEYTGFCADMSFTVEESAGENCPKFCKTSDMHCGEGERCVHLGEDDGSYLDSSCYAESFQTGDPLRICLPACPNVDHDYREE